MSTTNQQLQQSNQQAQPQQRDVEKFIIDPKTEEKFVNLFMGIHKCNKQDAERIFQNESFAFLKTLAENPDLNDCTQLSIRGCFLEAVNSGLSFSKAKGHVYLSFRNVTVKHGKNSSKEKRMVWDASPDGHVYLRQRVGSVQSVTTARMVYDCDEYRITEGDNPSIFHQPKLPRPNSAQIVLGYCYVIDGNGNKSPFWMDADGIERLKKYSEKNNGEWTQENGKWKKIPGKANELYTSHHGGIDPGFFAAKLKKFAVKDYRKSELPGWVGEHMGEIESPDMPLAELPEINESVTYEPAMIVTPVSDPINDQTDYSDTPPNEFTPDAENDLPVVDSPAQDEPNDIPQTPSQLFNNNF